MTATAAYPITMAELRGEPAHSSLWSGYGSSAHMSNRLGGPVESSYANPPPPSSHLARPRSDHSNVDHASYSSYQRYPQHSQQDEPESYDRSAQPALSSHHSYPNLKRSFSQTETPAYQEIVQDLRDDSSRLSVNQDNKLLAFKKAQEKSTIIDSQGRSQTLELSAQLHGMFFLSEMPSNPTDGSALQPELTCYRRNLFQISGSLITPRGQLSVVTESGETVLLNNMEVTISAIESVDGNPVRLIVIPWKTPPPNSPEVNQSPDQEPPSLPLIPFHDDGSDADGEYAVYPIGWRRLQFRIATANNGRRKELQQHFVLHLKVFGTLANGSKVVLTESTTAPIVVRGRSPRNFQARKEIPLLGSSAGSRGQALVESGLGVVAGSLSLKHQQDAKARGVDVAVPRSAFTFSPPKPPATQLSSMRSNSYPSWNPPNSSSIPQVPSSSPGGYPATTMAAEAYPKGPLSGASNFGGDNNELPLPAAMSASVPLSLGSGEQGHLAGRGQYTYVQPPTTTSQIPVNAGSSLGPSDSGLNVPRYMESSRPTKSPRHAGHQSVHSNGSIANNGSSPEYRYGTYPPPASSASSGGAPHTSYGSETTAPQHSSSREYFPPPSNWATSGESNAAPYTSSEARPYSFSHDQYKPSNPSAPHVKTEPAPSVGAGDYGGAPRGSFDAINNYSWSGN